MLLLLVLSHEQSVLKRAPLLLVGRDRAAESILDRVADFAEHSPLLLSRRSQRQKRVVLRFARRFVLLARHPVMLLLWKLCCSCG